MSSHIDDHVRRLNRIKRMYFRAGFAVKIGRALMLGGIAISIWALLRPDHDFEQLILGGLAAVLAIVLSTFRRPEPIGKDNILLSLEIDHPEQQRPAFALKEQDQHAEQQWQPALQQQSRELSAFEKANFGRLASTLVLPFLVLMLLGLKAPDGLNNAITNMRRAVSRLAWGASLTIVEGKAKENTPDQLRLSTSEIQRIDLVSQNMIEVEMVGSNKDTSQHVVELRPHGSKSEEVFQSFQLMAVRSNTTESDELNGRFKIAFSVSEPVDLYLPSLSSSPLAELIVKQLPVPKVSLSPATTIKEPWPDDKPLKLQIKVDAENPLRLVRLVIVSGKRTSQELVNNILSADIHELDTAYDLVLEPYVESDLAQVEIYAEAVDRSVPKPLVGRSESLRFTTASAYGRYRQTLSTLKELKEVLDTAIKENQVKLDESASPIMEQAVKQAEDSPFFDSFDRVGINNFKNEVEYLTTNEDRMRMIDMSEQLNDFLLEHEMLDARERDRDFFVAIRGLSRLLEQDRDARPVEVKVVTERIKGFLGERQEFWKIRTQRLPSEFQPPSWPRVRDQRPFSRAMDKTADLDTKQTAESDSEALITLSRVATEYRSWIEELEEREDASRAQAEQKRQQGLANARNTLKELQKRQGDISQQLDRADMQDQEALANNWPTLRMKQNTNLRGTKRLEAQMRALSPTSAARMKLAADVMEVALNAGNEKRFTGKGGAEQASDLAARALRQAQSAAQRSQQRQQSGRGRRRRVTGDRYFGKPIIGGDVEFRREYQVDKRYREDILNEVRQSLSNEDEGSQDQNRKVLESYLRQVIR